MGRIEDTHRLTTEQIADTFQSGAGMTPRFSGIYSYASIYNKPLMIAELGVAGDAAYRHLWLSEAAAAPTAFPRLRIIVYFNAKDPAPWPGGYGNPDWRIEPDDLEVPGR